MDGQERMTINLGSDPFATENSAQSADYLYLFAVGGVSGSALFDLSANGMLNYSIVANRGDFLALSATLTVNASPKGVPDGGSTAALLGIGFLGIYTVQRKRKLALTH
jgi:hypothetical protein